MSRIEDALRKAGDQPDAAFLEEDDRLPLLHEESVREGGYLKDVCTNFQVALLGAEKPAIMFASARPGEGVSTILFHVSKIIAQDKRTLIIDFNFLNPWMHKFFQLDNIRGLSDVITGKKTLTECIHHTDTENLDILPCGPTAAAAFKILGADPVQAVLDNCKANYDLVLVDSPALRKFPDTAILASACDGVVLVVRARKTKREIIQYAQGLLNQAGAKQLGVILNRVKFWIPEFIYKRL